MLRLGKVIKITKISAIQTAALSTLFFAVFITSYSSMAAGGKEMKQWENTKIKGETVFETEFGPDNYEVSPAEIAGLSRDMEDLSGQNVEVITPEAQLLMDISNTLGGQIGIACVDSYVNVRVSPDPEAEVVAKVYDGAVVFINEKDGDWFRITSGNAKGYVMSQYFVFGEHLAEQILLDEPYTKDELLVQKNYTVGITLEEEEAIRIAREEEARKERERLLAAQEAQRRAAMEAGNSNSLEDTTQLRKELVTYACQFVGLKYVMGGNSLETGTDCSGFTKLIYAHFGYGLDRTPSGQYNNNGTLITYAEAQPGDIIIYGKNGKATHAAIYIGDGKIIHAANSRQNTYIGNATYNTIMGVKRILD
ncbi:MAG: C40 family peptidase [Lachnospiraceae bacterium]|nr:C40 family peptidase [Lachnospiraceae bacterium]